MKFFMKFFYAADKNARNIYADYLLDEEKPIKSIAVRRRLYTMVVVQNSFGNSNGYGCGSGTGRGYGDGCGLSYMYGEYRNDYGARYLSNKNIYLGIGDGTGTAYGRKL